MRGLASTCCECGERGGFLCVGDVLDVLTGGLEGRFNAARFELVLFLRIILIPLLSLFFGMQLAVFSCYRFWCLKNFRLILGLILERTISVGVHEESLYI